jgi:hypothetical protein
VQADNFTKFYRNYYPSLTKINFQTNPSPVSLFSEDIDINKTETHHKFLGMCLLTRDVTAVDTSKLTLFFTIVDVHPDVH